MIPYQLLGLKMKESADIDANYFYDDNMLKNKVVIQIGELEATDEDGPELVVSVMYKNDIDAAEYHLYWDRPLEDIQLYSIVKAICDFYRSLPLDEFLGVMESLSGSYVSAKLQSENTHKRDIHNRIESVLSWVSA